jgi:hypothetical protein
MGRSVSGVRVAFYVTGLALLAMALWLIRPEIVPVAVGASPTYSGVVISDERPSSPISTDWDPGTVTGVLEQGPSSQWVTIHAGGQEFILGSAEGDFHLGQYDDAVISSSLGGCYSGQTGSFTIVELPAVDVDGFTLTRFAADLEYRCLNQGLDVPPVPWLHASIRLDASTPPAVLAVPRSLAFPDTSVGSSSTQTVTIRDIGRGSVASPSVSVAGPDADMFSIANDNCSGHSLANDGSCTFEVRFSPTATTARTAWITVDASDPTFAHSFIASGIARSPILAVPSKLIMNSDPGDWVGGGEIYRFDPATIISEDAATPIYLRFQPGDGLINFFPVEGQTLAPGHYDVPSWPPYNSGYLSISGFGRGCNPVGWFDILEGPTFDLDGKLLRVAIDFEQRCDGAIPRLRGSLRFHSTMPVADVLPPDGKITLPADQVAVNQADVNLDVTAADPAGVAQVALSNDGATYQTMPYATVVDWTLLTGNGTKSVSAKWQDSLGNWSRPTTKSILLDTSVPTATGPVSRGQPAGTTVTNSAVKTRISWSGSDSISGIDHYVLSQSTDGGAWTTVSSLVKTTSVVRNLAPGHTYRFAARPIDRAGNIGLKSIGPSFRITAVQQSSSAVRYAGSWTTSTSATTWWGGTARHSSKAGSTAKFSFVGRSIAWVGLKGVGRGRAQIFVNGVLKATVDLYSSTTLNKRVIWSAVYSASGTRTITIKVLGTSGRPRVDIDGFIVGT